MELCSVSAMYSFLDMGLRLELVLCLRIGDVVLHEAKVLTNLITVLLCVFDHTFKLGLLYLLFRCFLVDLFIRQVSHLLVALLHYCQKSLGLLCVHHESKYELSVITVWLRGQRKDFVDVYPVLGDCLTKSFQSVQHFFNYFFIL